MSNDKELHASAAFVDNMNLVEEGDKAAKNVKELIEEYNELHSATRGYI